MHKIFKIHSAFIFLLTVLPVIESDYFSAIEELAQLANDESSILKELEKLAIQINASKIDRFLYLKQ